MQWILLWNEWMKTWWILASLSFLFFLGCLYTATTWWHRTSDRSWASLLDFRICRILLPVTKQTWAKTEVLQDEIFDLFFCFLIHLGTQVLVKDRSVTLINQDCNYPFSLIIDYLYALISIVILCILIFVMKFPGCKPTESGVFFIFFSFGFFERLKILLLRSQDIGAKKSG